MGKGDIKTKRGKIANRSFGKRRPHQTDTKQDDASAETKKTSKK
jgi:ribosomal small subunit protein bTHX